MKNIQIIQIIDQIVFYVRHINTIFALIIKKNKTPSTIRTSIKEIQVIFNSNMIF